MGATGGREAARRFLNTEGQVKAKEVYLHLAAVCERAAANALLPEAKAGMLASAAVWRRLAANFRPWTEAASNPQQDKLAEQVRPIRAMQTEGRTASGRTANSNKSCPFETYQ